MGVGGPAGPASRQSVGTPPGLSPPTTVQAAGSTGTYQSLNGNSNKLTETTVASTSSFHTSEVFQERVQEMAYLYAAKKTYSQPSPIAKLKCLLNLWKAVSPSCCTCCICTGFAFAGLSRTSRAQAGVMGNNRSPMPAQQNITSWGAVPSCTAFCQQLLACFGTCHVMWQCMSDIH